MEQIDKASDTSIGITPEPMRSVVELSHLKSFLQQKMDERTRVVRALDDEIALLQSRIDQTISLGVKDASAVDVQVKP